MNIRPIKKNLLQFNRQGIINGFRAFKKLMWRSGPSDEHKKAWAIVDMVLMIRANMTQSQAILVTVGKLISGYMPY